MRAAAAVWFEVGCEAPGARQAVVGLRGFGGYEMAKRLISSSNTRRGQFWCSSVRWSSPGASCVCCLYIYIYIRIEVCVGVCELLFDKDKLDRLAPVNARALTLVRAAYLRYVAYMLFEFVEYIYEYIHESSRYAHI